MIFLLFFLLINSLTLLASKKQNDFSNWQVGSKSTPSGPQAESKFKDKFFLFFIKFERKLNVKII